MSDRPDVAIAGCSEAHHRLAAALRVLCDDDVGRPSRLAGWTVGHVVSHLARNAEAMCHRIDGARRGQLVEQYPGGAAGRAGAIEAGSGRSRAELTADVVSWSGRLDESFGDLGPAEWAYSVKTVGGTEHSIAELPFRRWREVWVHLVDLDVGIEPTDWPRPLVDAALPRLLAGVTRRTDDRALMAWLLGPASPPALDAWA